MTETTVIRPNPGPQEQFLACDADVAIYGGAAGGGKTWALLLYLAMCAHVGSFTAMIFRRESKQHRGAGGLWEAAQDLLPALGAKFRESPELEMRFPAGGVVTFDHMQHEKDKKKVQGKELAFIGFDELTHFTESQFEYATTRRRGKSGCPIKPMVRATCNPDPDSFVRKLIDWWIDDDTGLPIPERSGVIRYYVRDHDTDELVYADTREELEARYPGRRVLSLTFIASTLDDNPKVDSEYRGILENLTRVQRERLLGGNWNIKPAAGNHFRREWFHFIDDDDPILDRLVLEVRGWDLAATEATESNPDPDYTASFHAGATKDRKIVILHAEDFRASPGKVRERVKARADADGRGVHVALWQDPGQAGKEQAESYKNELREVGRKVLIQTAAKNKEAYADIWSPIVERGDVYIVRGPWNDRLITQLEQFPDGNHDDMVDAGSRAMIELTRKWKGRRAREAWKNATI